MIHPEDEPKINKMIVALERSKESSCIILVLCGDDILIQDVKAELTRKLEPKGYNFHDVHVTKDMDNNLPNVISGVELQSENIFFIFGLEKALPDVLNYLNYFRSDFVDHKISVVFWLNEPTLIQIIQKSPDFFAFRSLPVIDLSADHSSEILIPGRTKPDEIFTYSSQEEINSKIKLREEILSNYQTNSQDDSTIARLYNEIGILYHKMSQFDKAIIYYSKALELYEQIKDRIGIADTLSNLGVAYLDKGDLKSFFGYYSEALAIDQKIGNIQGEASTLGNIALAYYDNGELDKALEYLLKTMAIQRRIGDVLGEANTLNNIGTIHLSKGELDKALEYHLGSIELYRRIGDTRGEASCLGNIGLVYQVKGELDKALEYHSQALEIHRRIGNIQGEANQLGNIGLIYQIKGRLDKALDYTKKALRLFIFVGMAIYADIAYDNLQNIMEQMKSNGIEPSQEDDKEITELTEQYEKLKAKTV